MKKIINNTESIEEKKAKLKSIINKIEDSKSSKADILLSPFITEIKEMQEKKLSINAQLKALNEIGVKISYKTYQKFLIENTSAAKEKADTGTAAIKFILTNSGQAKPFSKKEDLKKLNFTFNQEAQKWMASVPEPKAGEIEKQLNDLKIGYDKTDVVK
jgi:septum formation inhibitor MinC